MKKIGKQSLRFDNAYIESTSTVAGKLEKEGPLGAYFDKTYSNNYCNMKKQNILLHLICVILVC